MKKMMFVIIIISILALVGCVDRSISLSQSQKNFALFKESIRMISANYGYEVIELFDKNIEDQSTYKDLQITIDKNAEIYIRMDNNATYSEYGSQGFVLRYTITDSSINSEGFNINFFVDLVNSMSGKSITRDFCEEFLNSPESAYPASKYGFKKLNGELVVKQKNFGFFEDWLIKYTLDIDDEEQLLFGGLTK
jgi:hypothetical protein